MNVVRNYALNERQLAVLDIVRMKIPEKQALAYLDEMGYKASGATLYRDKVKVKNMATKRLSALVKIGYQEQHLARIDNLEIIERELWQCYRKCPEDKQEAKANILEKIANLQPFISAYYDSSRDVINDKRLSSSDKARPTTVKATTNIQVNNYTLQEDKTKDTKKIVPVSATWE